MASDVHASKGARPRKRAGGGGGGGGFGYQRSKQMEKSKIYKPLKKHDQRQFTRWC